MSTASVIKKLNKAILEKNDDKIKLTTDFLIDAINDAAKDSNFYSLPFDQFSFIIKKVEFGNDEEVKEPFVLLQTIIEKTSMAHEKEAVLLLNDLKIENLPELSVENIIGIVSKFTKSELLTKLGELYDEEKKLLKPDYEYTIEKLQKENTKLKQELERKDQRKRRAQKANQRRETRTIKRKQIPSYFNEAI